MSKIFEAEIVGGQSNSWYRKDFGKHVLVKPFTHNYYVDAEDKTRTYNIKDVKIIREVSNSE